MSLHVPPYPPPRYTADTGEVSATLRKADTPPDFQSYGVTYSYLASQQSTDGEDGLVFIDSDKYSVVSSLGIGKVAQAGVDNSFTQRLLFSPDGGILGVQSPHALRIYSVK